YANSHYADLSMISLFYTDLSTDDCITLSSFISSFFFFNDTATTEIYTLSLHDALPISFRTSVEDYRVRTQQAKVEVANLASQARSEEHTSELQSRRDLVCRLLLEKKKKKNKNTIKASTLKR